ncbi:MAG: phosphoribosylglycinamide formyltransferase [Alistipes sp.]|nr:phosphoribosylglycinamide formyltransferase [Alistipes sp.]MBQ6869334.1 phosphoribosylglycinamide formyltransferase [Alistipes sp.]
MHRIAVFASGKGTNFEAIAAACSSGELDARVVLLVCDKPQAEVVAKAARLGIECFAFSAKEYSSKEEYEQKIVELLDSKGVELVCLAGYMRIVGSVLLGAYGGRIINIHPSLLPAFAGARAVEQAIEYGVKVFGITIHWVDSTLDGGKIIAQRAFEYEGSDAEQVHRIGQQIEHKMYVETIKKILK